jgi:hypothetical protein
MDLDHDDDLPLVLATTLVPGETLTLLRGDGPLIVVGITAVDGVDVAGAIDPASRLGTGELLTARLYSDDAAWFATFVVQGVDRHADGPAVVDLRLGDALRVTSERWSERVAFGCAALVREEAGGAVLRGRVVDLSLTGVGVVIHGDAVPLDAHVGVTLEGDGRGSIAFRAAVVRRAPVAGGHLLGLEVLGVSRADHGRLARLLRRHADAGPFDASSG